LIKLIIAMNNHCNYNHNRSANLCIRTMRKYNMMSSFMLLLVLFLLLGQRQHILNNPTIKTVIIIVDAFTIISVQHNHQGRSIQSQMKQKQRHDHRMIQQQHQQWMMMPAASTKTSTLFATTTTKTSTSRKPQRLSENVDGVVYVNNKVRFFCTFFFFGNFVFLLFFSDTNSILLIFFCFVLFQK
jgi:hypothetical protein